MEWYFIWNLILCKYLLINSHNDGTRIGVTNSNWFVRQNHGSIQNLLIFDLDIFCSHSQITYSNPSPYCIRPSYYAAFD